MIVPSWRPADRTVPRVSGEGPKWRAEPDRGRRPRAVVRFAKVAGTLATFSAVAALLIWVSSWLRLPRPVALILVGAGYETNLAVPPNVYGWKGLVDLSALAGEHDPLHFWRHGLIRLAIGPKQLQRGGDWSKGFTANAEPTVVLFVAAHGGSDRQGAYLLPNDSMGSSAPVDRIRLEEVLDQVAKLPAWQNKVLIFDATQVASDWNLGMLNNEFARHLEALDSRIGEIPNLIVIGASGPDQKSWTSDEWQQTVFTHYIIEGLRGAADIDSSGRIDAWELHRYTSEAVRDWVWSNRIALQTPMLLPQGKSGEERAREMVLAVREGEYVPPDPNKIPEYTPPKSLHAAWQHCQEINNQTPSPAVFTPHLWRRYRDVLMRYDTLVRQGADVDYGPVLLNQLEELEQAIDQAKILPLVSIQNTLSMPAAAGYGSEMTDSVPPLFQQLWTSQPKDYPTVWAKMRQNAPNLPALRLSLYEQLYLRAAESPVENLQKVCDIATVIEDPVYPVPAEIRFVLALNRDLPPPSGSAPAGDLAQVLKLALNTGLLSDRSALGSRESGFTYTAQINPWLRSLIDAADGQRLLGQDLLFVGDQENLGRARGNLHTAQGIYRDAFERGSTIQRALTVRDRVIPMLPYYCRWVAAIKTPRDVPGGSADPLIRLCQNLCKSTDRLLESLRLPELRNSNPISQGSTDDILRSVEEQSQIVEGYFQELESRYLEVWREFADVSLPSLWSDAENALSVPYLDPDFRMRLITHSRRISRQFLIQTAASSRLAPSVTVADNRAEVQQSAQRHGLMAMALLGRTWFNETPGTGLENFDQVEHRLNNFLVEEQWWESLAIAGDQIGLRWSGMPAQIDQWSTKFRRGGSDARVTLSRTVDLTRRLPGSAQLAVSKNPVLDLRKLLIGELLLWQAQRTLNQHWFAETENTEPYYRTAGLLYTDDAMNLLADFGEQQTVTDMVRALNAPGDLEFSSPGSLDITSQQETFAEISLRPAAGANIPPGYPVVSAQVGANLTLESPAANTRIRQQVGMNPTPSEITYSLASPLVTQAEVEMPRSPSVNHSTLTLDGIYRGQRIRRVIDVQLDTIPSTILRQFAPPTTGTLAVRAGAGITQQYGASQGAVTFVLDCSGSMGPPVGQPVDSNTKLVEATTALGSVLSSLPKGTTVSIWIFGESVGPDKTVQDPGRTIRQVVPPTYWDPTDPNQYSRVMNQLTYPAVEPWNQSPIVRSMVYAKEDLERTPGSKTMVVITDGMDNCFESDAQLNPSRKSIPVALTEIFGQSDMEIIVVGFKVEGQEQRKAEEQFEIVKSFRVPGQFHTVDQSTEITDTLSKVLTQRLRYRVETLANVPVPGQPAEGMEVSSGNANIQWFPGGLPPGAYNLLLYANQWVSKTALINRGDLLLANLVAGGSGLTFQRELYTKNAFPWRPAREVSGWRLALLQNQALKNNGLQMLLALEKIPNSEAVTLALEKPAEAWFEVVPPANVSNPFVQIWNYEYGYPAPCWSLNVPSWPVTPVGQAPSPPTVKVWWNPDQAPPPAATLLVGADFKTYRDIRQRSLTVDGNAIVVENVRVENHLVETKSGQPRPQSCLVVRVSNGPNAPSPPPRVSVRIGGISVVGREDRYYAASGTYTLLLWPVTADEAEAITDLRVYSLADFKNNAERRGFATEMSGMGTPDPNDARPQKPVALE
ncbi:MAG: hypothetical protein U1D30_15050 [Planctomycetota bacterium]